MKLARGIAPALLAAGLCACAQLKEIINEPAVQHHPTDLSVALLPLNTTGDPSDAGIQSKIAAQMDALKLFKTVKPATWGSPAGADLILTIHQCFVDGGPRCDDDRPIVTVSSGRSGKLLYTARPRTMSTAKFGVDPERIAFEVAEAFSHDGPLYALVSSQQKPESAVPMGSDMKIIPADGGQAENEGDAAERGGQISAAFTSYVRALDGMAAGDGTELRQKLLKLSSKERALADVPQDARRHSVRAETFMKIAQGAADYRMAVSEYEQAVSIAPWWAEAYRDLGYVQERVGDHKSAMRNLKLYLLGSPAGTDAQAVQDKIYALEVMIERGH